MVTAATASTSSARTASCLCHGASRAQGPGEFALLHNIWVDERGRVIICDRENNRIQIFDGDGNFLEEWTDLESPGDLWIHDSIIYVVEQGAGTGVSIWTLDGDLLSRWRGSDEGAAHGSVIGGHGICVDSPGQHLRDRDRAG